MSVPSSSVTPNYGGSSPNGEGMVAVSGPDVPTPPLSEEPESLYDMESLELEIGLPGVEKLAAGGNNTASEHQQFIKRPLNAYMIFTRIERKKIMAQDPKKKMFEVSREMGERWKALNEGQKKPFFDLAKKHKELHQTYLKQNPEIAYHPQRKKTSKHANSNAKSHSAAKQEYQVQAQAQTQQHIQPSTPDYNQMPAKTISPNAHLMVSNQQQSQQQYSHHMNSASNVQSGGMGNQQNGNGNMYAVQQPVCSSTGYYIPGPASHNGMQLQMMQNQGNDMNGMTNYCYTSYLPPGQGVDLGHNNNGLNQNYYFDPIYGVPNHNGSG
uniref:HMG box domain-containing protein n=1 Tax=Rhabditophanes sp. KR3021 TaxID=114890 RepID=A0AC35UDG3_9BILA